MISTMSILCAIDVAQALRDADADVLVSYLPVGSEDAQRYYAQACLDAGVGFVNAIPVFIASDPEFELSLVDIDRPPPYYAYQTLALLREAHPDPLIYLMGSDSLRDLPTWKMPMRFLDACDRIGVMERATIDHDLAILESQLPGLQKKIIMFPAPFLDISASDIRRRIHEGLPYQDAVDPRVGAYIEQHNLYK